MEPSGNDKVQNFLLGVTTNAENFSMFEASAIDTPSEMSFFSKKAIHAVFQQEPFIASLHEWLNSRENTSVLSEQQINSELPDKVLNLVKQMSNKIESSILNKEEIRQHLSAPMPSSGLPLHHDNQRNFMTMMESLQHLASKQDECVALSSKKFLQNIHKQIETAVQVEQRNMELQQTLLNMVADSELVRQRKLA